MDAAAAGKSAPTKPKDGRQFNSAAPKAGGKKGFSSAPPGKGNFGGADLVCPWEEFGDMELNELTQFGII